MLCIIFRNLATHNCRGRVEMFEVGKFDSLEIHSGRQSKYIPQGKHDVRLFTSSTHHLLNDSSLR